MLWNEKKRSRIRAVQMENFRGFLVIWSMDRVPNARIRECCGVTKRVDERNDGILRWLGNVERMENDRIDKRAYVGECTSIRSLY